MEKGKVVIKEKDEKEAEEGTEMFELHMQEMRRRLVLLSKDEAEMQDGAQLLPMEEIRSIFAGVLEGQGVCEFEPALYMEIETGRGWGKEFWVEH